MNGIIQKITSSSGIDLSEDNIYQISCGVSIYYYSDDYTIWPLPQEFYLITFASLWAPNVDVMDSTAYLIQYYKVNGDNLSLLKQIDHDSRGNRIEVSTTSSNSGDRLNYSFTPSASTYSVSACGIYLKSI